MIISYHLLKGHVPDLNERDHTEKDFWKILKRDRVRFEQADISVLGYYEIDEYGQEHIVINSQLTGAEWLRTAFHETTHHFLDYPISDEVIKLCRSMEVIQTRQEINAEALSLILMFSFPTLENYILTGDIPEHLEPYIEERLRILEIYGI